MNEGETQPQLETERRYEVGQDNRQIFGKRSTESIGPDFVIQP